MNLKKQIRIALGIDEVKLQFQAKLTDGTIIVSTGEDLVAGGDVSVLAEDGTTMPLPVGSYETEDGVAFSVEEDGVVAEVGSGEEEAETEEVEATSDHDREADAEKRSKKAEMKKIVAEMRRKKKLEEEAAPVEEVAEEVVEEVVVTVEEAVVEIAEAIDAATPEEVTPEVAAQAAEIAVEVLQEKAEEVLAEVGEAPAEGEEMKAILSMVKKTIKAKDKKLSKMHKQNAYLKRKIKKFGKRPSAKPVILKSFLLI